MSETRELTDWQKVRYGDSPETRAALAYYRERGWPVDNVASTDMIGRVVAFTAGWREAADRLAAPMGEMRSVAHEIGQVLSVYERRKVVPLTADERQMVARLTMWHKRLLDAAEVPHAD